MYCCYKQIKKTFSPVTQMIWGYYSYYGMVCIKIKEENGILDECQGIISNLSYHKIFYMLCYVTHQMTFENILFGNLFCRFIMSH